MISVTIAKEKQRKEREVNRIVVLFVLASRYESAEGFCHSIQFKIVTFVEQATMARRDAVMRKLGECVAC